MGDTMGSDQPAAGGVVIDLFTTVPVNLFRSGNASGPRLDNLRDKDVTTTVVRVGDQDIEMVEPAGGISTFDNYDQTRGGKWWKIPAGTALPDSIRVKKDHFNRHMGATHYSIQPARLMSKHEFVDGLRRVAEHAIPMFGAAVNATQSGAVVPIRNAKGSRS